jgi:hypothetical protein
MRAANDTPASAKAQACAGSIAGIAVAFSAERKLARTERTSARRHDPRQDNDNLDYDDLLGMVRAEMAQPSA